MTTSPCDREQVFWWSPPPPPASRWRFLRRAAPENAGDLLGPCLVERILRERGLAIRDIRRPRLFSIGSVLHFARDGDTVWGSGINGKQPLSELCFWRLDVRAVRGPLTAVLLRERGVYVEGDVYGDPGILTARYWPRMPSGRGGPVYVPHMREQVDREVRRRARVVSPLQSLEGFIDGISEASIVYSTSLHGIIIAESYGIPAVLIRNRSGETRFKYDDYYQGTGRFDMPVFDSLEDVGAYTPAVPDLRALQARLLAAFPLDLWTPPAR
jgi:pyruvyltransferase